jgi:hypothetical protein
MAKQKWKYLTPKIPHLLVGAVARRVKKYFAQANQK